MSDIGLFFAGVLVMIPTIWAVGALILAAIREGRENDRIQAQRKADDRTQK